MLFWVIFSLKWQTDGKSLPHINSREAIANAMADRNATMVLFNTPKELGKALRGFSNKTNLIMQVLRANECPWEGSDDYQKVKL